MEDQEKTPLTGRRHDLERPKRQTIEWKYYIILPIIIVIFTGIGLEYYTSAQWIQHYVKVKMFQDTENASAIEGCKAKNHSDPDYKTYEQVQKTSANWQLYKMLVGCVPSFLLTLILPSYSDVFGRRFLFILGLTGMLIHLAIESAAIYFELELYYFISGSAINGFFGGFYSILSASYSYIADVTKGGGRRTLGFSAFDGLILVCITLSALACGYIITYAGFFIPLASGTILTLVALLLTVFFLPETHDKKNRATSVNIRKVFSRTVDFYKSSAFKGRRLAYILLLLAFFFEEVTTSQRSSIEMIFQLGMPLCWTAEKVGIFTALRHAAQALASTVLIVPLKACCSELTIAIWSALFNAGSYVMEGIAQTDLTMYLGNPKI